MSILIYYHLSNSQPKQRGMTFIEVLVATFILSVGFLSALTMQVSIKKANLLAVQHNVALVLAQDMIERIRGNHPDVRVNYSGVYDNHSAVVVPSILCFGESVKCTPEQLVEYDLFKWQQLLRGEMTIHNDQPTPKLHNTTACIKLNNHKVSVNISWRTKTKVAQNSTNACLGKDEGYQQLTLEAFI